MRVNVSMSSAALAGEFVVFMFNVRTMTHIMHLNTRSNAQHMALNDYYSGVVDLADRFAESSIGQFKAIQWPESLTEGIVSSNALEPIDYLNRVKVGIAKAAEMLDDVEDLENILAEILELTTKTLYKLENLA